MTTRLISVILPVYNQADHIEQIVTSYVSVLAELARPYELLLVTNACRDKSPEICRQLSAKFEVVKWFNTEKAGWGSAVRVGIAAAEGDTICYTNSARTSPDVLLLTLFYSIAQPDSVIKANRKIRDNWKRRIGSFLFNLECRALFDLPCWDVNGTPKVFPRKFSRLMKLTRDDDLIDAEFNAICRRYNYPMIEVPVLITKRHGGKSTTNYNSAVRMYLGAFELWRNMGTESIEPDRIATKDSGLITTGSGASRRK